MSSDRFLPYTRQLVDEDDIAAVTRVLSSDWLTTGPAVSEFEEALAAALGARHAVVCANGTAALHLSCLALGLGPGEASIVPSMTFVATANASRYTGADVVFADVDPTTGLLQPPHLERALERAAGRRVRAVFVVHLNGQVQALEQLSDLARERGLAVIEDASHALGTTITTRDGTTSTIGACRFSDMTTFSFHPAKVIAMGEGGAVTTNDDDLARWLRIAREHGIVREREHFRHREDARDTRDRINIWYHEMQFLGFNYRASDIHCALGTSQLAKLPAFQTRRRALMACYDDLIESLKPLVRPVTRVEHCHPTLHLYPVLIDFRAVAKSRGEVMRELRRHGIGTQVHYFPVHRQDYYRDLYGLTELPGAEAYYQSVLSLPFHAGMNADDVSRVIGAVRAVLKP